MSNIERPFTLEQYRALKVDKDEAQMDAVMARAEETRAWGEVARLEEQLAGAVGALREIGTVGGPLYLLEPNQGERPDPIAASLKLREILDSYWSGRLPE